MKFFQKLLVHVLCLSAMLWFGGRSAQAQCNQVEFAIEVAPDNQVTLPLYWTIQSPFGMCPARDGSGAGNTCGSAGAGQIGELLLPPGTTPQQKCQLLVADITARCTGVGSAQFSVTNQCNLATPTFLVSDPLCPGLSTQSLLFGVTNDNGVIPVNQSTWQRDYERDRITPGCAKSSAGAGILKGTTSGVPIVAGSSFSSVVMQVDLRALGGGVISQQQQTFSGQSAAQVLGALVPAVQAQLNQTGLGVQCVAQGSLVRCNGPASANGAVSVKLQLNETGLSRALITGNDVLIRRFASQVDTDQPLGGCGAFNACNLSTAVVGVPAMPLWGLPLLAAMLCAVAWFLAKGRFARRLVLN